MAISNHAIISKMQRELQMLQDKSPSKMEIRQHIGNVKLMCELLLENEMDELSSDQSRPALNEDLMEQTHQQTSDMTEEEYNVMIKGKDGLNRDKSKQTVKRRPQTNNDLTDHDGANGDSIFDF